MGGERPFKIPVLAGQTFVHSPMRTYWRDPGYWRWLWHHRAGTQIKLVLVFLAALALGIAGYLGARGLDASKDAAALPTDRVVTVIRKTHGSAAAKVVTKSETVTRPGKTDVVTVRRNGRTIEVRSPQETVTVHGRTQQRVVTNRRTTTVARTVTADRRSTVTGPGATVTTPGATVTTPGATVTTPGPTETVTKTVTEPARTVTETTTAQMTITVTVTGTLPPPPVTN